MKFAVVTTYYSGKNDVHKKIAVSSDNFSYIERWYNSVNRFNYDGFIFHNNLSEKFIHKYQTNKIKFIKVDWDTFSPNDVRFLHYFKHFYLFEKFDYIFLTDGNDVVINRDLSTLIKLNPAKMYVGRDWINTWKDDSWTLKKILRLEECTGVSFPNSYFLMPVLNAGVLGGKPADIKEFLLEMEKHIAKAGDKNINMPSLNYLLFKRFFKLIPLIEIIPKSIFRSYIFSRKLGRLSKILSSNTKHSAYGTQSNFVLNELLVGYPLTSKFRMFEKNSDAYFIHQ